MTASLPAYFVEPFDPERHDRAVFSSGVPQVDNFLRQTAAKLARANNLRLYVMSGVTDGVIGFYAVNAHAIDYSELPHGFARTRPRHGQIPAAYVAMIGVDQRYLGCGHGRRLLMDALTPIADASESLGIAVVLLDVLGHDEAVQVERRSAFYLSFGFQPLPQHPLRLFMPITVVRRVIADLR